MEVREVLEVLEDEVVHDGDEVDVASGPITKLRIMISRSLPAISILKPVTTYLIKPRRLNMFNCSTAPRMLLQPPIAHHLQQETL
jgi:hypothetical protein